MIPSLVLLQLGLVAAAPITISSVDAVREGGRLAITVQGDAMIDPEAEHAREIVKPGALAKFIAALAVTTVPRMTNTAAAASATRHRRQWWARTIRAWMVRAATRSHNSSGAVPALSRSARARISPSTQSFGAASLRCVGPVSRGVVMP